jgi:hypothetical protein
MKQPLSFAERAFAPCASNFPKPFTALGASRQSLMSAFRFVGFFKALWFSVLSCPFGSSVANEAA